MGEIAERLAVIVCKHPLKHVLVVSFAQPHRAADAEHSSTGTFVGQSLRGSEIGERPTELLRQEGKAPHVIRCHSGTKAACVTSIGRFRLYSADGERPRNPYGKCPSFDRAVVIRYHDVVI